MRRWTCWMTGKLRPSIARYWISCRAQWTFTYEKVLGNSAQHFFVGNELAAFPDFRADPDRAGGGAGSAAARLVAAGIVQAHRVFFRREGAVEGDYRI